MESATAFRTREPAKQTARNTNMMLPLCALARADVEAGGGGWGGVRTHTKPRAKAPSVCATWPTLKWTTCPITAGRNASRILSPASTLAEERRQRRRPHIYSSTSADLGAHFF